MRVDDRRLGELITESQDLQVDALRTAKEVRPALVELSHSTTTKDPDVVTRFNTERRRILRNGGLGAGALAARGLLGTAFGTAVMGIVARPAAAQEDVAVAIFQTACSLEILAVATYGAALELPFIGDNPVVKTFAETTMMQHDEHCKAFQAQTEALGGEPRTTPSERYAPAVAEAKPGLVDYPAVVALASILEEVAQDTYIANLALLPANDESRPLMASVLAVETQHLATLRAVGALLEGGVPELIAIPTDLAALPAAAGSVAFPEPFEEADMASPPEEGAL
ncbi:MAG TPA: ferritin-like domain-containing protein [Acidimicrobiales bacterium]|nr:ferritin-like domain-containing protein [Acidimicrobiales bacterium]